MSADQPSVGRVVVVHGPAAPELLAALAAVGLVVTSSVGDTTVWGPPATPPAPPSVPDGAPKLLTIAEAATLLGVGCTTTRKLIMEGQLAAVHVGRCARVPAAAVDELIERLRGGEP